jgi:hypothetical protein
MSGIRLTEVDDATIDTPPAGKATLFLDDVLGPAYKDDAGAVHEFAGSDAELSYLDHGNTGSTETVDAQAADIQRLVANAATVTLTLSNWPAAGTPAVVRLWLEQDGTGGRVWSWPGAVDWGDAGEPDWASRAAGAVDVVDLMTVDGGTNVIAILHGRPGDDGAIGPTGGAVAVDYTFSTTTTDSDPGAGNLRLSNATQASATVIRADLADAGGADVTALLDSLDDATNTVKGHIRLSKKSDPTKWLLFTVASIASPSGYRNITVANVGTSGVNPLTNGDAIVLTFTRAGDQGPAGTASVGTDGIWDTKGDSVWATGADAASKLAAGSNGMVPVYDSAQSNGVKTAYPPGYELDYVQKTSNTNITATTEGTADTILTGNAVTYDGTPVMVEFWTPSIQTPASANQQVLVALYEGSTILGYLTAPQGPTASDQYGSHIGKYRFTPSAGSHTYHIKAIVSSGTGVVFGGAGGTGAYLPCYMRITKV